MLKYSHPIRKNINHENNYTKNKTENDDENSLQRVLDALFPIKCTQYDDYILEEHVSTVPATRADSIALKETLDNCLEKYEARETGICDIRQQLYDQCFDEIIRQVTINCIDRGLLLYRIRNQMNMTIDSLKKVYESGIAFGLRTCLTSNKNNSEMDTKYSRLEKENSELKLKIVELQINVGNITNDKNEIINNLTKHYNQEFQTQQTIIYQQKQLIDSLKRKAIKF